ncbi:MAG: hypothetical protein HZB38_16625 [Planctomycetes bacterium]|nr:hypothetical protein [Planctomycetota bacterium]
MNWEINNRAKLDAAVARRSPHAAKQPLSDAEIESRRGQLQQLARTSLAWWAFWYVMGCFAWQAFWTAVAAFALTRGVADLAEWFFSATAYSGAAVLVALLHTAGLPGEPQKPHPAPGSCNKGCGRRCADARWPQ